MIGELVAVLSLVLVSIVSFLSLRKMNRFENLIPNLNDIFQQGEDGEVLMDERIVKVIDAVGSRLFQSAKMSMLQGLSVNSKLEGGLKSAFAKDIIDEKMPILNMLGDFMGVNVKQYVAKNPDALMQLLGMPQVQGILSHFVNGKETTSQPSSYGEF